METATMEDRPQTLEITDSLKQLIHVKARQVVGKTGLTDADRSDVEQELWLDLLRRWPKFQSGRAGISTFVSRVVSHKVAMILRSRRTAKRASSHNGHSLDVPCRDEDGQMVTEAMLLDEHVHRRRTGQCAPAVLDTLALKVDTAAILSSLDSPERWLCEELMRQSVLEIARASNISRTKVYQMVYNLRKRLVRSGVQSHLEKNMYKLDANGVSNK
jgi:RNA polymerase sigma-70 factor (ECF subfamily)